ncbi:MAG: CHAT domain-containing protein [Blastocatellia bacterium]
MKKNLLLVFLLVFLSNLNCNKTKISSIENLNRRDTNTQKINIIGTTKKIARDLANNNHVYELELLENQVLSIDFEQFGIDIKIKIISPDNDKFIHDLQKGIRGKEHFIFISKTTGTHKLIILPANDEILPGKYEIEFKSTYTATKLDFIRYKAVKNLNDVLPILMRYEEGNKDFYSDIIKTLENSLETFKICKDFYHLSLTQTFVGDLNFLVGNYKKANSSYNAAILIADEIMEPDLKIYPMSGLAFISMRENRINESVKYFKKGIEIATQTGDLLKKAYLLSQNGNLYVDNYEIDLARILLEDALILHQNFGQRRSVFLTYLELGFIYFTSAQYQKCIEMFVNALNTGEKDKIEDGVIYTLILLSKAHLAINDSDSAIKYILDAHKIVKGSSDNYTESLVLHELANLYGINGDTAKAEYFYKLGIEKAKLVPMTKLTILNSLADFYLRSGELTQAKENLDEATKAAKASNKEFLNLPKYIIYQKALTNLNLGKFFLEQKDYSKAYKYLKQSLDIYTDYDISELQSEVLFYIAKLFLAKKDFEEARKNIKESIYLRELIEEKLAVQDLQLFYLTKLQDQYDLYIELLIKKWQISKKHNDLKAALAIIEKSKMRVLSQNVAGYTNKVVSYQKLDNLEKNLELKKGVLASSISQLRREKINLLNQVDFDSQQLSRLDKKLGVLKNQYHVLEAKSKIKKTLPNVFNFDTVKKLLDEDTTIIEYYLSNNQGWAFIINKTNLTCFEIKNYSEINKIVRDIKSISSINQQVNMDLCRAISNILFGSIDLHLLKSKLVIIPSGLLTSLPWSALPINGLKSKKKFLIENYELILLPSISVLMAQKSNSKMESEDILVVSDPVTERIDQRLESAKLPAKIKKDGNTLDSTLKVSPVDNSYNREFSRLYFSQEEAKVVTKAFQKVNNLSGFNANIERLRSFRGKRLFIFHLAAHAMINTQDPELSYIVLSLFDKTGNTINGYFTFADIYELGICADIVILSSCDSGVGKEVKGEGMLSFSYAFISTGSSSVVSSLWKIDDKFTSIFMNVFYEYLKNDPTKPASALRKTQTKFINDPNWSNPFYWAGFTIQGSWN